MKPFTPRTIASTNNYTYHIPIYQRVYEWDEDNIITLLDDLHSVYCKSDTEEYYVGTMTSFKSGDENQYHSVLIDGQQRFITLMIFGIVMREYHQAWNSFLVHDDMTMKLHLDARRNEEEYLMALIQQQKPTTENIRIKAAIECVSRYLDVKVENKPAFSLYVFEHLSFFISEMPQDYSARELNEYFETMNTIGHDLELHEILKVNILKDCDNQETDKYTKIWNLAQDMIEVCSDPYREDCDVSIKDIEEYEGSGSGATKEELHHDGYHAIMSFSQFLLNVLYIIVKKDEESIVADSFFDERNLLTTFSTYLSQEKYAYFFEILEKCCDIYKQHLIFVSEEGGNYRLGINDEEIGFDDIALKQYFSMLYVNSNAKTYHHWFCPLLACLIDNRDIAHIALLQKIKEIDNNNHPMPNVSDLMYGVIDRYWFWRLDYYIWENRESLFSDGGLMSNYSKFKSMADNYVFRSNRSIEHIAPQHPVTGTPLHHIDDFGNLVMISSSFNSRLSNSDFLVKRGYVQSHLKDGEIESLAMILLYKDPQYNDWTDEDIQNRTELMMEILKRSY